MHTGIRHTGSPNAVAESVQCTSARFGARVALISLIALGTQPNTAVKKQCTVKLITLNHLHLIKGLLMLLSSKNSSHQSTFQTYRRRRLPSRQ